MRPNSCDCSGRRRWLIAAPLLALGAARAEGPPAVGQPAPNFKLQAADGSWHELAQLVRQRRVTVVNFWATWCGPCVAEMPEFDAVHRKLQAQGLSMLGVNVGEKPPKVQPFAQRMHLSYPLLLDPEGTEYRLRSPAQPVPLPSKAAGLIQMALNLRPELSKLRLERDAAKKRAKGSIAPSVKFPSLSR